MTTAGPVTVVGLGCIGGSLARALTAQGVPLHAWSESVADRELAAAAGISVSADLRAALQGAAAVIIATPLLKIAPIAADAMVIAPQSVVMHTGSLQRSKALELKVSPSLNLRVIGTHPVAGSHETGFAASRADLFAGCAVSIETRASDRVRATAESLWRAAGAARFDYRSADEHDRLMTWVSHLPQLVATALAGSLDAAGIDPSAAGPGARDTSRLAASALELWAPLLAAAPEDLDLALAGYAARFSELRAAVTARDAQRLAALWEPARTWRRRAGGAS
jgi:prephenate dehydrogenase